MWWVWVYTSWITNWLDPEKTPVRLLLFALTLGGLVLSTSIPAAFDGRGLWFAIAYAAMQVGKTIFLWVSTPPSRSLARAECDPHHGMAGDVGGVLDRRRLGGRRIAAGAVGDRAGDRICFAGGAVLDPPLRRVVGRGLGGRGRPHGRTLRAFVIIALGESVVVTGATFAELSWTTETVSAFVSVLAGSIAMWWIYFHKGAEAGSEEISRSSEPGRLARLAYTYLHMPIVAGIIVSAVADELVLKHPRGHSDLKTVMSAIGGPLLFLFGTILFKYSFRGFLQLSHGFGIIALGVLAWFAGGLSPLILSILTTAIMIVVAVWELISLRSQHPRSFRRRAAPGPDAYSGRRWLHEGQAISVRRHFAERCRTLDDERPKPRIFLDERHPLGVLNSRSQAASSRTDDALEHCFRFWVAGYAFPMTDIPWH